MPPFADNRHIKQVKIDQSAAGVTVLVADADVPADQLCYVVLLAFGLAAAGTLTLEDTAGTDLSGQIPFAVNGGLVSVGDGYHAIFESTKGLGFQVNTVGAGALAEGWCRYFIGDPLI